MNPITVLIRKEINSKEELAQYLKIPDLQRKIGLTVDRDLLIEALTTNRFHGKNSNFESYTSLAWVGDAIIETFVRIRINMHKDWDIGRKNVVKDQLVNQTALAEMFDEFELGNHVLNDEIEVTPRDKCEIFEALIGAIFHSFGYEEAFRFLDKNFHFEEKQVRPSLCSVNPYQECIRLLDKSGVNYEFLEDEMPEQQHRARIVIYLSDDMHEFVVIRNKKKVARKVLCEKFLLIIEELLDENPNFSSAELVMKAAKSFAN